MASKWGKFKDKLSKFEQPPEWQEKVNEVKKEAVGLDTPDLARHFAQIRQEKKELEAKIKDLNTELEAYSQLLVEQLEDADIQKIQLGTGETVYLQTEPYAAVEDKGKLMEWVKRQKLTELLALPWQTLNSQVKELLAAGKAPMPGVAVFLKTQVRVRGGGEEE